MRLFGSERIAKWMDKFGFQEGDVIQHPWISNNVETAQKKVEENNFGVRKRLLEFDDVMNTQREVIYKKRRNALYGERLSVDVINSFYDLCEELVITHKENSDFEGFKLDAIRFFSLDTSITETDFNKQKAQELSEKFFQEVQNLYDRKQTNIAERTLPIFKQIHSTRGETVKNVVVPFTDGIKGLNVLTPLEKNIQKGGRQVNVEFEKAVSLSMIDESWKDQLRQMDDLKKESQAASYEQKDPLLVYKLEAFNLFEAMISEVNRNIASFLFKANIPVQEAEDVKTNQEVKRTNLSGMQTSRADAMSNQGNSEQNEAPRKLEPVRAVPKTGRNEPCPCGSGKKYKNCHGLED